MNRDNYLNKSTDIINKYVDVKENEEDIILFLQLCIEKEKVENQINPITAEQLLYYEIRYRENEVIQDLVNTLKQQIYNQICYNKKLITTVSHNKKYDEKVKNILFGDGMVIYNSTMRCLLQTLRDGETVIL